MGSTPIRSRHIQARYKPRNDSKTPTGKHFVNTRPEKLVNTFIASRRSGTSPRTVDFCSTYLNLAKGVVGVGVSGQRIARFLDALSCTDGGKHAYYRTLRAFYNWLYSPRSGCSLVAQDNPMLLVESPEVGKKILPSLTLEQLEKLIGQAPSVRDAAIISLFADTGLRLSELASINPQNIDWQRRLIKVRTKGNKEGFAAFGQRTEQLLREWLSQFAANGRLWGLSREGIASMLKDLREKTGLPCNPHTFRRTFASILAKRGVDSLHIMRLGRWESMAAVERYTRSVRFEDSLKLYNAIVG